jgi:hypothetical protein
MKKGTLVKVAEPVTAVHLIDRGMLSTSISVELLPTDTLVFFGRGLTGETTLRARPEDVESLLARATPIEDRQYAHRSEFLLNVARAKVVRA